VSLYVRTHRRRRIGLGAAQSQAPVSLSAGFLRDTVQVALKRLALYDRFLRNPTFLESRGANNSLFQWMSGPDSITAELMEFWTRLSEAERKSYVGRYVQLVDSGPKLHAELGTYPAANRPPTPLLDAVTTWIRDTQKFVSDIDALRYQKRVEVRSERDVSFWDKLKRAVLVVAVGAVGAAAIRAYLQRQEQRRDSP
jgi:hypothetical protein